MKALHLLGRRCILPFAPSQGCALPASSFGPKNLPPEGRFAARCRTCRSARTDYAFPNRRGEHI
ncbi:hypothetical protein Z950_4182 [Sulfitobacter mediterraneus KCTC 32188]|nr:hypothetical protein Z950_4182 [Sulfitobacter mediterraneus KCTC 32188]